jgi:4-hydroxyacetophenone monooxygenase
MIIENGWKSMCVRREVFDDYNERMDAATARIIWEGESAGSYYVNEFGRSAVNMPWAADLYHTWLLEPRVSDFEVH